MHVEKFIDQYDALAETSGLDVEDLRHRDSLSGENRRRWLAIRDGAVVGFATARERPDSRLFLQFGGQDPGSYRMLAESVASELGRPLYAAAKSKDGDLHDQILRAGFRSEVTSEVFAVPFAPVLEHLSRVEAAPGFAIVSAADVDLHELFALDNRLRQEVPGTDGWQGNIDWLRSELAESPPFEPNAYLVGVAIDGDLGGLARVWRNEEGPRFGMVATLPRYRRTLLGPALIRSALLEAQTWGHQTFTTETSLENVHLHSRLVRAGAISLGLQYQMMFDR